MGEESRRWPFSVADLLRSLEDGLIALDAAGRILWLNPAAEALVGTCERDAIGKQWTDLFGGDAPVSSLGGILEQGASVTVATTLSHGRSGTIPVCLTASPLRNGRGESIGLLLVLKDLRPMLRLLDELEQSQMKLEQHETELKHVREGRLGELVGISPKMQALFQLIRRVAKSDATVLIQGESGTGKELIASTVHALSPRRNGPFVKVNCAALPEGLLESELFGHERGAFTGAIREKPGRFELADRGTIFLDEVGDVSPSIQVKLLRVLQERAFERVGGTKTIRVDVRVIAATNRDLLKAMQEGGVRDDLYYRLNVIPITAPSLRERKEDIPALVTTILQRLAVKVGWGPPRLKASAMRCLLAYEWPGNVRELENVLEFVLTQSNKLTIQAADLAARLALTDESAEVLPLSNAREERERQAIRLAMGRCGGDVSRTAKLLGIGRTTLWRKMRRYGLLVERGKPDIVREVKEGRAAAPPGPRKPTDSQPALLPRRQAEG